MEVWELTKPLFTNLGNHKVGELFYVEPYTTGRKNDKGDYIFYPFKGGYPTITSQIDIQNYSKKISSTKKPKEYFVDKKYTQYEVDKMLKKKS